MSETNYNAITDKNETSFCPAKWQEITFMPAQRLANACHRTQRSTLEDLPNQQADALNGIRNPLCKHCWTVEDAGQKSSRQQYIEKWDGTFDLHTLRINIGSLCNMGCSYCNHRISTVWLNDILTNGEYDIKFDYDVISGLESEVTPDENVLLDFIESHKPTKQLAILGGEPFINKLTLTVIDALDCTNLDIRIPTNMCFPNKKIAEKVIETPCQKLIIAPSIDVAHQAVQEFTREGFDWELFHENLDWFMHNSTATFVFLSVLTPHNIWWIADTYRYVMHYINRYPGRFSWDMDACVQPRNQSFEILTPDEKTRANALVEEVIQNNEDIGFHTHLKMIQGFITGTEYNAELRKDQQKFFEQFAKRRKLIPPEELAFLLVD